MLELGIEKGGGCLYFIFTKQDNPETILLWTYSETNLNFIEKRNKEMLIKVLMKRL